MEAKPYFQIQIAVNKFTPVLRTLFLEKYKKKTNEDWSDNEIFGKKFTQGIGNKIYKKSKKIQQIKFASGNSNEWDIPMFSEILKELFFEKTLSENLTQIIQIRNKIAHAPSLDLSEQDFNEYSSKLLPLAQYFGIDAKIMEDMKTKKFKEENDDALEIPKKNNKFNSLKEQGNLLFNNKNYKKAIELYSETISLPDISSKDRAILYSNRSCSYLNLYRSSHDEFILLQSISDAKQAITLWPHWCKGYIRLGNAYEEKNKQQKALMSYEKAIELDPTNITVQDLISNLKLELKSKKTESLNSNSFPTSFEEEMDKLESYLKERTGTTLNKDELAKLRKNILSDDMIKAFQYMEGTKDMNPNKEMAYKYFAKEAEKGNPEAMHNLAIGLMAGSGINKDPKAGLALFEKAANMPPFNKNNNPVIGVAESQFALGDLYEHGIYVDKDIDMAIYWYEKANLNGHKTAPNNLGVLYFRGDGVKIDFKKAEKFFLMAYQRKEPLAETNLTEVYIRLNEPNQALMWHERAIKNNKLIAIKGDKDIRSRINLLRELENDADLMVDWESDEENFKNELGELNYYSNIASKNIDYTNELVEIYYKKSNYQIDRLCFLDMFRDYNPKQLEAYKKEGSITAENMLNAGFYYLKTLDYLFGDKKITQTDFISNMAKAVGICSDICAYHIQHFLKIDKIIDEVLFKYGNSICSEDENARICYIFNDDNRKKQDLLQFAKESLEKYPKNNIIKFLYAHRLISVKKLDQSLELLESLAKEKLDSKNIVNLHTISIIYLAKGNKQKAIENMTLFVHKSQKDHKLLPSGYYILGELHQDDEKEKMKYYKLGLESESYQLPIYLPFFSKEKDNLANSFKTKKNSKLKEEIDNSKSLIAAIDPMRLELFLTYRKYFHELSNQMLIKNKEMIQIQFTAPVEHIDSKLSLVGLKPIFFRDMDKTKDNENKNFILTGMIVDEIQMGRPSVHMIIEDEKKDVLRVCLYNLGRDFETIGKTYEIGSVLQIVNPFLRVGLDDKPFIKVLNPKSVIIIEKREKICRFCGKENSLILCHICNKARYCSSECQKKDLEILKHDYLCLESASQEIKENGSKKKKKKKHKKKGKNLEKNIAGENKEGICQEEEKKN